MNKQAYEGQEGYCCFHPRERVVGVCAHCLKERLLLLLDNHHAVVHCRVRTNSNSSISLPKQVLATFLQRLDSRHHQHHREYDDDDATASVASLDDSFISIKFEDNGKATWDSQSQQQKVEAAAGKPPARSSTVVLVEHVKRGGVTRWRKQVVGRLLQLARWRRSSSSSTAGGLDAKKAAAAERSKARGRGRGWIRSLTRYHRRHGDRAW